MDRLATEARSFAGQLDRLEAGCMAADEHYEAICVLAESARALIAEIELHRPTVHQ